MPFSASNAKLLNQCVVLWLKLYLGPLFNIAISSFENSVLVSLITLG